MLHLPEEIQDHIWEDVHILKTHEQCLHELKHLHAQSPQNRPDKLTEVCIKESLCMEVVEMCLCFVFGFVSASLLIDGGWVLQKIISLVDHLPISLFDNLVFH